MARALVGLKRFGLRLLSVGKTALGSKITDGADAGYCPCCRDETTFLILGPWLRDQYVCSRCRSIPRNRALNHILDQHFPGWEKSAIHESSPTDDHVGRFCDRYSYSHYFQGVKTGQVVDGVRCEDIERLTFPDNHFDIFITQDVLEHVFNPSQGIKEIMRVIKPGGAHVFTTPKHRGLPVSRQRARLVDGNILYLDDAQYHGNPVGDGKALVTWDYGDDFERLMWNWCGYPTATYVTRDRRFGIDGEYLEVFVTRKI